MGNNPAYHNGFCTCLQDKFLFRKSNKFESFEEWYSTTAYTQLTKLVALNFTLVEVKATTVNWVEKEEMAAWPATFYCKWEQRSMKHKVITFDTLLGSSIRLQKPFAVCHHFSRFAHHMYRWYTPTNQYLPPSLQSFTLYVLVIKLANVL